jgi:hypothetical protein
MKGCGCQKSSFSCSFSAIGCVLFVCKIIVFDVCTSIKQCWYVGMLVLVMEQIHSRIVLALGGECGSRSRALVGARDFG